MFLKNLLLYLQIFTLTASLTRENTGTKSNQREGSDLKSVNEQYGPGDSRTIEGLVSIGIDRPFTQDASAHFLKHSSPSPKQLFSPKTPTVKVARVGPPWVKNIAKHFKDKFLQEDYKRTERAIYPSKCPEEKATDPLGPVESVDGREETFKPEISHEFDDQNGDNVEENVSEEKIEEVPILEKSKTRVLCFVNDSSRLRSLVVPCHFVSRLFYYVLVPREPYVVTFEVTDLGDPTVKFSSGRSTPVIPGPPSTAEEISGKDEERESFSEERVPLQVKDEDRPLPGDAKALEPSPDAQIPATSVKVEDDISAPKKESEMPSFDEWKMQQEEGKNKDHKEQNSFGIPTQVKTKVPKKEINYASVTCGAKVIQANPEAQNPSYMLYENKDQYMINPCSAKKGFTVELCESIQVQSVELGNMEFFSSLPQSFDIHVSERFPVKEWIHVGTFLAKNERTIQSFPVEMSLTYVKYIRVDVLSHYGSEHFCPLSILRVFGVSLDDDDEVEVSQDETDYSDIIDVVPVDLGSRKASNLFSKATDTVISIMKTVLPSSGSQSQDITNGTDNQFQTMNIKHSNAATEDRLKIPLKEDNLDRCLIDFESVPQHHPRRHSLYTDPFCSYYRLLIDRPFLAICPKLVDKYSSAVLKNASTKEDKGSKPSFTNKDNVFELNTNEDRDGNANVQTLNKVSSTLNDKSALSEADDKTSNQQLEEAAKLASETGIDKSIVCNESLVKENTLGDNTGGFSEENSRSHDLDGSKKLASNASNASKKGESIVQSSINGEGGDFVSVNQKKEVSNEGTAAPRLEPLKDYEFDASNLDDVTYQKLSSKGKESVFAKLKNRIKNLEINLNLTNRYLEELSQRYKKQTEEMYTSLNKTISKLINTAKSAEERDLRQQDKIQSLEVRFSNLTTVFSSLHRALQNVHSQVLERHLMMMAVEFALFFALLTYFHGNRGQPMDLQSRRSSAPAIPGKVVTSDPSKITSKSQGDAGTLTDMQDEEASELPKQMEVTKINDGGVDGSLNNLTSSPPVDNGVVKGGLNFPLSGPSLVKIENGICNLQRSSPKDGTCAQTIDSINDKLVFVASEKLLHHNRKTANEDIVSDTPSSIQHKTNCKLHSRPHDTDSCNMHCDRIFKDYSGVDINCSSQVDSPFPNGNFKKEEFVNPKSKSIEVEREFSSSQVLMETFPMHLKRRAKRRTYCFPSDKGLRWTRNLSNYLGSRTTNELVRHYFPRDSVVIRIGFKPRIFSSGSDA